jgi:hypothetical protein
MKTKFSAHCGQTTFSHKEQNEIHAIAFNSLRVVLYQDKDGWVAQALEVDHFSMGDSDEEAIHNFMETLSMTIASHVEKYGHAKGFLKPAPIEVMKDVIAASKKLKVKARITLQKIKDGDFPKEVLVFQAPKSRDAVYQS